MADFLKAAASNLLPFNAMATGPKVSSSSLFKRHHSIPSSNAVSEAVFTNPSALGLAVIVSNDYTHTQLRPLTGTHIDSEAMQNTFKQLRYAVVCRHNINKPQLLNLLSEASLAFNYPPSYRRIVFVFSGHGTRDNCLYTQDCQRIHLDSLISMFLPKQSQHLAAIPKLFFIDACRGDKIDPGCIVASRGPSSNSRGGKLIPNLRLPCEGNYLLAYSTMNGYQAYEMKGKGGIWLSLLSQHLAFMDKSVLDILTDINREMMEEHQEYWRDYIQQPELHSSLNEAVYFLREAREISSDIGDGIFDFESSVQCTMEAEWINITTSLPPPLHMDSIPLSSSEGTTEEYSDEDAFITATNDYTTPAVHETLSTRSVQTTANNTSHLAAVTNSDNNEHNHTIRGGQYICSRGTTPESSCIILSQYCHTHNKPSPTYAKVECNERGKYLMKVYVAKTVGWVEGLKMSKKELARESAANELLKKLQYTNTLVEN